MASAQVPDVTVEKLLSRKGNEYSVPRPADAYSTEATAVAALPDTILSGLANIPHGAGAVGALSADDKPDFGIAVRWDVQDGSNWNAATPEVKKTAGITQYYIQRHSTKPDGTVSCTLHITNTKRYGYHFYDETGDGYWLSTWLNRDHSLDYESKKPNIVFITGD
ncbi:hypothetical protein FA13DRAFT_664718 [Coprinellus micaceus]|uniref:Uncharacterized protein n=1 Tax=Coprinellus micaceus TaxID=71717 RepID=A0A4Y7T5D6_COPMI|nr:hypothetical protein FA13DRAFT_664718 [Coprinellus micaceus]